MGILDGDALTDITGGQTLAAAGHAARHNDLNQAVQAVVDQMQVVVNHGATAETSRPAGATFVKWVGSVEPTNATDNDEWWDTTADLVKLKQAGAFVASGTGTYVSQLTGGDGADIVAALSAAASAGGGQIHLDPSVTWDLSSAEAPLTVPSNVLIDGHGATIRLANSAGKNMLVNADTVAGNDSITLRNITFDGNRANQSGAGGLIGLKFHVVSNLTLDGVTVKDVDGIGVDLSGQGTITREVHLDNLQIDNCNGRGLQVRWQMRSVFYRGVSIHGCADDGAYLDHSEGFVESLYARDNDGIGIYIHNVHGCSYSLLSAMHNGEHGIFVEGLVQSVGGVWRASNNGDGSSGYADLYFSDDASGSYGLTDDVTVETVWVGRNPWNMGDHGESGTTAEDYGVYFADGMSAVERVNLTMFHPGETATQGVRLPASNAPGLSVIFPDQIIRKASAETRSSTTTLADDDTLVKAVGANEVWEFEWTLILLGGSTTPDFKMAVTAPTGSGGRWLAINGIPTSSTGVAGNLNPLGRNLNSEASFGAFGAVSILRVHAVVNVGATAGNVALQWAQDTSSADTMSVQQNSLMRCRRLT